MTEWNPFLSWKDDSKRCPVCNSLLEPLISWPGNGEVSCPTGHFKGLIFPNLREMGPIMVVES